MVALHNDEPAFRRSTVPSFSNWRLLLALGVTASFWLVALAGAARMLA